MDIEIKKLSSKLTKDFLYTFDNPAFFGYSDFSFGCYCTWYNWTDELENERSKCNDESKKHFKRNLAVKLIEESKLNGFMAYFEGSVVGWCNAGLKQNYERLCREPEFQTNASDKKILSIVCYVVHPDMHRKGIATALLKAVCDDAKKENYDFVEAYPGTNTDGSPTSHGSYSMYAKQGFEQINSDSKCIIMRKKL
jgi:GNAT superfamily N-acetyltransferase